MSGRLGPALAAVAFFGLVLLAYLALAAGVPLNHDEHQFVSSAALVARYGLLPYVDFPYFHVPNLVGVYALVFRVVDELLLGARAVSTLCAWACGVLLFFIAWGGLAGRSPWVRVGLSLGVAALCLLNPVVTYTFPKAWNNVPPALLILAAFLCHCRGARAKFAAWFLAGGLLFALAAGCRITFAPLGLAFLLGAVFGAAPGRRVAPTVACIAGMFVGSLPMFAFLAMAPGNFLFDNFIYNGRVNSAYRLASGDDRSMLLAKLEFVLRVLVNPGNLVLLLAFAGVAWQTVRRGWWRGNFPLVLLAGLVLLAIPGVLAPTPSYSQYYFILALLLALGVACVLPLLPARLGRIPTGALLAVAVAISFGGSVGLYGRAANLFSPGDWTTSQLHEGGRALREAVPAGKILTVAPIVPLEGGLEIYPAFVTGPFAWRTAPYLSAEQRAAHGFVSEAELPALLAAQPPAGILIGYDRKREKVFLNYAKAHGYRKVKLPEKKEVWVPK